MKTKHTPEPWRVGENSMVIESVPTGMRIGEAYDTRESTPRIFPSSEEAEANLRIIAAAPELLEALENLVFLHGCEQEGLACGQPTAKQWIDAVDAAQKAIDKAKGENK